MTATFYASITAPGTGLADVDHSASTTGNIVTLQAAVTTALGVLVADGASPTQAHVTTLNNAYTAFVAAQVGTPADVVEIRMGNGTYVPTHREVLQATEGFRRWLVQRGLDGAGANLPPNAG